MTERRKNQSEVWTYFTQSIIAGVAVCKECQMNVSMGSKSTTTKNTSNMWNHLKIHHSTIFEEAKKKKDAKTSSHIQASLPMMFEKQTKWKTPDVRSKTLDRMITEMIATDNQPFTMVQNKGFQRLMATAEPRYTLKSEKFYRTEMFPSIHNSIVEKVKALLKPENAGYNLAFTTDCWSGTTESLMSLTCHYIDDQWIRRQVILNTKAMIGSHTGEYISEMFLGMLEEWDIDKDRVVLVLRDSGANIVKGMRIAELPDMSCSAHILQLVVNDGLNSQRAVQNILSVLKSCATHFNHSVLAKQRLAVIQQDLGLPAHAIIQAVPTRWNSTLHMLVRMQEQRRALNMYASEHSGFTSLSADQWSIVTNLIETLSPVEEVTLEMSHYESSASCIIPSVKVLKMLLSSQGPSSRGIKTMRQEMLESLTRRFAKVEEVKCAVLACLLDPRYKAHAFSSDTTLLHAKDWLKEETKTLEQDNTQGEETQSDDSSTVSKRPRTEETQKKLIDEMYDTLLGATSSEVVGFSLEGELQQYVSEPVIDRRMGKPLEWWKQNEKRFPILARLSRKFLCPPPSSVPSERVFSEVGAIYENKRSRLTGQNAERLCFLHYNLVLLNWEY
ncbi:zinc finger BED domain-containing protein 4-like [Rhinichthys klamathensis goyatoka]|uniref:zinc finger BED domain-containing protein 4-like n=1 Tax=Rhinichthys klamathensis goyatoka TaxID=3034132 RepID=UPI0024B60811|nr:zinc finger BED domain-containing protein 4-like [Rhinichthys klamathensis goyatoka]